MQARRSREASSRLTRKSLATAGGDDHRKVFHRSKCRFHNAERLVRCGRGKIIRVRAVKGSKENAERSTSNARRSIRNYAGAPPSAPGSGGATSGATTCLGGFS